MDLFDQEIDNELCNKQMTAFSKMSGDFSNEYECDAVRMISLHLSLFTLGCASIKMSDESFKKLMMHIARNFKSSRDEMHE